MRRMILTLLVMVVATWPALAGDAKFRFGLGGGYVQAEVDFDAGALDLEPDGLFVVWRGVEDGGATFALTLSKTKDDSPAPEFLRLGTTLGVTFNPGSRARVFVTWGFGFLKIEDLDDNSVALTFGIGIVAGRDRHNFYAKYEQDFGHDVDVAPTVNVEFDYREIRVGYLHRF